jgi:hypothetical protein
MTGLEGKEFLERVEDVCGDACSNCCLKSCLVVLGVGVLAGLLVSGCVNDYYSFVNDKYGVEVKRGYGVEVERGYD